MTVDAGIAFAEALAIVGRVAGEHRLGIETLALSRTHGRVLAQSVSVSNGTTEPEVLLHAGQRLTPGRVSVAASQGLGSLQVSRKPTVAVFTVGDHLIEPGMPLAPGQAYDSSRELVMGLLRADGLEPTAWPRLPHDARQIEIALRDAGCAFDLIIACGDAGKGALGDVAAVLAGFGREYFREVRMQPGSQLLFGCLDQARLIALPHDPASVLAAYLTLGRALIDGLQGGSERRQRWHARLTGAVEKGDSRREFRPSRVFSDPAGQLLAEAEPSAGAASNALIVLREGAQRLKAGVAVEVVGYD